MIRKIRALEEIARLLDPPQEKRNAWNRQVQQYVNTFLDQLDTAKAFWQTEEKGRGIHDHDITEEATGLTELLEGIRTHIDSVGVNAASGGHMGYIPGGGVYPAALGDYMAAISNRYAGVFFAAPGAVRLENMLVRWMCRLMGFPETAVGNLTSGGSIAILIAIVTAREHKQLKAGNFDKAAIYLSEQAHHSIRKALRIAGLSEARLRYIPLDEHLRLSVEHLDKAIEEDLGHGFIPFFVNASLGTTNTGTIDPMEEVAAVARKYNLWFHVDAAYGGFFKLLPGLREVFKGVEKADSITLDPHKGLFLPFGTGAVLIRHPKAVYEVHHYMADYMQDITEANEEISPADVSPELTKHFRGMRMWLPLKLFGLKPFRAALEEKIYLTRYFYEAIRKTPGFETGPFPELSVAVFRYLPEGRDSNDFNQRLIESIRKDGRIFLSSTTIDGVFWIRIAVLLFRTHLEHIHLVLKVLKEKVDELEHKV